MAAQKNLGKIRHLAKNNFVVVGFHIRKISKRRNLKVQAILLRVRA